MGVLMAHYTVCADNELHTVCSCALNFAGRLSVSINVFRSDLFSQA